MKRTLFLAAAGAALIAAGCGDEENPTAAGAAPDRPAAAYTPVSDVAAHAAIGRDMAAIRAALDGGDFAAAARIWNEGKHSRKDDGEMRTLAGFAEESPIGARVADALAGEGTARRLDAEQRAEWVDKGMVAALELKVLDELDAALEKARAGEIDAAEGAPHNVDEAWAFYTAGGEGLHKTAEKRAADFDLGDAVGGPVLAALRDAQQAAKAGDGAALLSAREAVRGGLNRIFALAVTKYANEGIEDEVARAEGLAFSWGLHGDLPAARLKRVEAAFGAVRGFKRALAAREALNASLAELGLDAPVPAYEG